MREGEGERGIKAGEKEGKGVRGGRSMWLLASGAPVRMTLVKIMAGSLLSSAVAAARGGLACFRPSLAGSQPTRRKQTDDGETDRDRNDLTTGRGAGDRPSLISDIPTLFPTIDTETF